MEKKLEKSWKDKMITVLGAAALHAPMAESTHNQEGAKNAMQTLESAAHSNVNDWNVPFGEHAQDKFLKPISYLESSGGRNVNHATVESGIHAGDTAIGRFGFMPKTFQNVAGMLKQKNSNLRQVVGDKYKDEEVEAMHSMDPKQITEYVKANPNVKLRAVRYLAAHLDKLHNGDQRRMAHGWRFGSNRPSDKITDKMLNDSGYVKKFKEYSKAFNSDETGE